MTTHNYKGESFKNYKGIQAAAARSRALTEAGIQHVIRLDINTHRVWASKELYPEALDGQLFIAYSTSIYYPRRVNRKNLRRLVADTFKRWDENIFCAAANNEEVAE